MTTPTPVTSPAPVLRYVLSNGFPREHDDGKYVLATAYDALTTQLTAMHADWHASEDENARLKQCVAQLEAALGALVAEADMMPAKIRSTLPAEFVPVTESSIDVARTALRASQLTE